MISVLAVEVIDGKGKGRALQLSTRDPLELREDSDVPFSQCPVCLTFPGWLRPGPHGPERPCSVPRAVTLIPVVWTFKANSSSWVMGSLPFPKKTRLADLPGGFAEWIDYFVVALSVFDHSE